MKILQQETIGDIVVAKVGLTALDIQTTKAFRQETQVLVSNHCVVLDLEAVEFIDSTGLGALLSLLRKLTINGGDLRLSRVGTKVLSIFRLVRMNKVFEIYDGVEEAVESFLSTGKAIDQQLPAIDEVDHGHSSEMIME